MINLRIAAANIGTLRLPVTPSRYSAARLAKSRSERAWRAHVSGRTSQNERAGAGCPRRPCVAAWRACEPHYGRGLRYWARRDSSNRLTSLLALAPLVLVELPLGA